MSHKCIKFDAMRMNEVFGAFLREYRKNHGLTMEQIANATHEYGSGWDTSAIGSFERGKRSATLSNILIILQSLSDLTGEELGLSSITFSDAMDVDEEVQLNDELSIDKEQLRNALEGGAVDIKPNPELKALKEDAYRRTAAAVFNMADTLDRPLVDWRLATSDREPTISEKRAAVRLGIPPKYVTAWCYGLFDGRSLDEETTLRAGEGANAQKRGRATRLVVDDIRKAMDERANCFIEDLVNHDTSLPKTKGLLDSQRMNGRDQ